jgi:hypothetical protein
MMGMVSRWLVPAAMLMAIGGPGAATESAPAMAAGDLHVRVAQWSGGKRAAISLRFDGSDRTHIERAVPMLNASGLVGTFMVTPGTKDYQRYRRLWEGDVLRQGHELGNGTWRGRGGKTDREAEEEISRAAHAIRRVQPNVILLSFTAGETADWLQRKPMRYFEAKYDLFSPGAAAAPVYALSCGRQNPSFSVAAFRAMQDQAMSQGGWMQPAFGKVGDGPASISPEALQKLLEVIAGRRDDLWTAGISAIYQYDQERERARVWARAEGDDALALDFVCAADPRLFRQPLTLEVDLPAGGQGVEVTNTAGAVIPSRTETVGDQRVARFDVAPADATYTVRAKGIGIAYRAAGGDDLAAPGPHPYLFFTQADLPGLREKTKQGPTAQMWQRISSYVDSLTAATAAPEPPRTSFFESHIRVRSLAFAYALTGEEAYATRARPEWQNLIRRLPVEGVLNSADGVGTLALAYDWMYDALSEAERAQIRAALIEALRPVLTSAGRGGEGWATWRRSNWGGVIYGQAAVAALVLLDEEPRAAEWARILRHQMWDYTWTLGEDGGWGESGGYGLYAWHRILMGMDAFDRVSGHEDLFRSPNVPHLWQWFTELLEPDEVSHIPFSNSTQDASGATAVIYRIAGAHGEGHAQWFADRMATRRVGADVFGFIWRDPDLAPVPPDDLPKAKLFRDIDWAMLRSRWGDPEATLLGFKGGQKDWDHHHNDTNQIVLYAYGRPLIVDLLYVHRPLSSRTEAHNTIMVNEREQRGWMFVSGARGKPDHRGIIGGLLDAPWYAHLVGDASLAYEQDDVRSFVREIMYLRRTEETAPPDYFVMLDDVDATKAMPMDWNLHTYGDITVDGPRITFTQDEAAVDVTMLAPTAVTTKIEERSMQETGSQRPFPTATTFRWVKVRPTEPTERGLFLSVLAPRRSGEAPTLSVTSIREANILGADIRTATTRDLALFALEAPEIRAGGVEAAGRSCFVRRTGERVAEVALYGGQWLSVDGRRLFETDGSGQVAIRFGDDAIEASLDLQNAARVRLFSPRRPVRVLVDGVERPFVYDADHRWVEIVGETMSRVTLQLH